MSFLAAQAAAGMAGNIPGARSVYLPSRWGMLTGQAYYLYWSGLAHLRSTTGYTFTFSGPGSSNGTRWMWSPTLADVGTHRLTVRVYLNGVLVARATTVIEVFAATGSGLGALRIAGPPGDSITAAALGASAYVSVSASLLGTAGYTVTTHGSASNGTVDHDGYSGRTYLWHDTDGAAPWSAGGAAHLAANGGGAPDYHVAACALGTNDLGPCRPDHPEDYAAIIANAESLVGKMLAVCRAVIVCPVYEAGDGATIVTVYNAAAWEENRRRINALLFETFEGREAEGIYMGAPIQACLDRLVDIPSGDVHPVSSGHAKIGACHAGQIAMVKAAP